MKKLLFFCCFLYLIDTTNNAKFVNSSVSGLDSRQSCTIIYASDSKIALAGNNEDYTNPFGTIWFIPADSEKFGRVYFGWRSEGRNIPQGGMNDQGLFFDGATAENIVVPHDSSKPRYESNLTFKAMEECSTVEEVVKLFDRYDNGGTWNGQYLFGDRFGNSVIIEPNTIIRKNGKYQIVTNFLQSKIKPENITDKRYRIASELFEKTENISIDLIRRILNATHWEEYSGSMTVTLYSYICDLKKGDIYIYHFHNFDEVVKINLKEELKKGERFQSILSLFPYETFASKRYNAQRTVGLLLERAQEKGIGGDTGAIALFREIKRGDFKSYNLSVVEGHLLACGYEYLQQGQTKEAIEIFKYAAEEYPQSATIYEGLGEAYGKAGYMDLAIQNFKKSLDLDPDRENARMMLDLLEKEIINKAREIHERAIILDSHVDIAGPQYATTKILDPGIDNPVLRCDLVKMEQGGIDGIFLAVTVKEGGLNEKEFRKGYKEAIRKFEAIHRLTRLYPDRCALALTSNDVERINGSGKKAIMTGLEGGYVIGNDLSKIEKLYNLGTRYITLVHNGYNLICNSSDSSDTLDDDNTLHNGISEFGKKVVANMNQLGIICDVSHMSEQSFYDLIEISRAPVIASHSCCRTLCDHVRNLSDNQIRALAKKGGVVQLAAVSSFLKPIFVDYYKEEWKIAKEIGLPLGELRTMSEQQRTTLLPTINEFKKRWAEYAKECNAATVKELVDHIDYIVKIAGIDHVGIGTDFDGGGGIPGFENHSESLNVTIELVRRGYSENEIGKIWGGNLLRVWREVERVASEKQLPGK